MPSDERFIHEMAEAMCEEMAQHGYTDEPPPSWEQLAAAALAVVRDLQAMGRDRS